jgi:hypothetical protein
MVFLSLDSFYFAVCDGRRRGSGDAVDERLEYNTAIVTNRVDLQMAGSDDLITRSFLVLHGTHNRAVISISSLLR